MSQLHESAAADSTLLAAARAGDTAALGELMAQFRLYLLRVAEGELNPLMRPKVMPSDIVQDTYLEAYTLFERFDGDGADEFRRWLRGILLNKTLQATERYLGTAKRNPGREERLTGTAVLGDEPTPSSAAVREEQARRLVAAVGRLPDDHRLVVQWRNWDDLSFAEIGSRLGRSEDAARMLFARAMKRLHEELANDTGNSSTG